MTHKCEKMASHEYIVASKKEECLNSRLNPFWPNGRLLSVNKESISRRREFEIPIVSSSCWNVKRIDISFWFSPTYSIQVRVNFTFRSIDFFDSRCGRENIPFE